MNVNKSILEAISEASKLSLSESDLEHKILIPIKSVYNAVAIYANQSRWISVKTILPTPQQNVLAICNGKVEIMALTEIRENGEVFKAWAMVYDGLDGDAFYDEDYGVTHWMEIPKP